MEHHHNHNHNHNHSHAIASVNKAFIAGILLNAAFVAAEFSAGIISGSMSLLSDAGHNLSDIASLILAMLAFRLAKVPPTAKYTYGYKKSTVLVSLLNAIILLVAVGLIIAESIHKLRNPQPVSGGLIIWVAGIGVVINAVTAWLFIKDKEKDLNIKGAYLHMAADALVSAGVVVSGIIIMLTGWWIIDPLIGLVVAAVIIYSTWGLLRSSLRLSLDGVPSNVDYNEVTRAIMSEKDVRSVHHMHIWAISTTETAMTAHIVISQAGRMSDVKEHLKHVLGSLGIGHVTLEFETDGEKCGDKNNGCAEYSEI